MKASDGRRKTFEALLCSLFDDSSLRMWLRVGPNGDEISRWIPGQPISLRELVHQATNVLQRFGLIDRWMFEQLIEAFPSRQSDILLALRIWVRERPQAQTCPRPHITDPTRWALSEALEQARSQREEIVVNGDDTGEIDAKILRLRRAFREGPQLEPGDDLHQGRYRLLSMLGHGTYAIVWRAYDREDHQEVAIKVLLGQWTADQSIRERFTRGASKMARMSHPSIVRIVRGTFEDGGYLAYVMALARGGDLKQRIEAGRPPEDEILGWFIQLCGALAHAHDLGFVHRDIKPANIVLGTNDVPQLTDFDLMKAASTTGGTRQGAAMGTWRYAAPEASRDAGEVDERSDVFSLGMTLLYCLRGRELDDEVFTNMARCIHQLECSYAVKRILTRATARNANQRFASAREMLGQLHAHLFRIDVDRIPDGTVVSGRHRIVGQIGRGTRSAVYLGEHVETGRKVAIKVLGHAMSRSELIMKRFRAEARAASASGHPNIVEMFDSATLPDGRPYLVMEYIRGVRLDDELQRLKVLPLSRTLYIVRGVVRAIRAAHDVGIIHRNLEPSNVMIVQQPDSEDEQVKVLDFGSSAGAERTEAEARLTIPGHSIGDIDYCAPEQGMGKDATELFDIYALGVLLYECLTGQVPFDDVNAVIILKRKCDEPAPSLGEYDSSFPPNLIRLVDESLASNPAERPQSAHEFLTRLEKIMKELAKADPLQPFGEVPSGMKWRRAQRAEAEPVSALQTPQAPFARAIISPAKPPEMTPEMEHLVESFKPMGATIVEKFERPLRLGEWFLLGSLGEGKLSAVYLASRGEGPSMRSSAIKLLSVDALDFRQRFNEESQRVVDLNHPNIVRIQATGTSAQLPYIVMELIESRDFSDVWDRCAALGKAIGVPVVVHIIREVLRGLHHAHTSSGGLIHRNISPNNILITGGGQVLIADFGLATSDLIVRLKPSRRDLGDQAYMSPEQIRGEHLDGRADVFACGVLLWEFLTGKPVHTGHQGNNLPALLVPPSAYSTRVDRMLDALVVEAVTADRRLRHSTAEEFGRKLDTWLSQHAPGVDSRDAISEFMSLLWGSAGRQAGVRCD